MEPLVILVLIVALSYWIYAKRKRKKIATETKPFKTDGNYAFGLGFEKMDKLAADAFESTAKDGDIESIAALGVMYFRGVHYPKDYEKAYECLKIASDAGHPYATYGLYPVQ